MTGRILIADEVATNRIVMKVKLSSACYQVLQAAGEAELLELARRELPDLIILDAVMSDANGAALCAKLKADPTTSDIPVIMVTALNDTQTKLAALEAGADDFLTKPLDELTLLARVRSLLRMRATSDELRRRQKTARELGFAEPSALFTGPGHVAIVAAEGSEAMRWRDRISPYLNAKIEALPEQRALEALQHQHHVPDAFVIASDLGEPNSGLRLLAELRSREATRHAAIIIMHAPKDRNAAVMALDLGANDLISDAFDPEELALRLRGQIRRKLEADRLRVTVEDGFKLAAIDPLTGLYNRRYALPHLKEIANRGREKRRPFAIMLLDLDRFKDVNDTYGHAAGDTVLVEVARRVRDNLRGVDMVARIGGEEFLVAMPETALSQARFAAERLRQVIEETPISLGEGQPSITVTLSIGLSMGGRDEARSLPVEKLIEDADQALFGSKAEGRNQVTMGRSAA
ncbi:MAG: diguanylate cyclase [Paracoccaceae bacterium]